MVDQTLDNSLDNPVSRKESLRARALLMEHLKKFKREHAVHNLLIVENLNDMLQAVLETFPAVVTLNKVHNSYSKFL